MEQIRTIVIKRLEGYDEALDYGRGMIAAERELKDSAQTEQAKNQLRYGIKWIEGYCQALEDCKEDLELILEATEQ